MSHILSIFVSEKNTHGRRVNLRIGTEALKREDVVEPAMAIG